MEIFSDNFYSKGLSYVSISTPTSAMSNLSNSLPRDFNIPPPSLRHFLGVELFLGRGFDNIQYRDIDENIIDFHLYWNETPEGHAFWSSKDRHWRELWLEWLEKVESKLNVM